MPANTASYRIPQMRRIGRGEDTEKLYELEQLAAAALRLAACQVLANAGLTETADYYRDVLPEAIFTLLESQDCRAALAACLAYLDWYRNNRAKQYAASLQDWREQRGKEYTISPAQ